MRSFLIAGGWVATVAAAFVLGKTTGEGAASGSPGDVVVRSVDRPADVDPGPVLAPGGSGSAHDSPGARADGTTAASAAVDDPPGETAGETLEPFTLEGVTDPDVAMGRLMQHLGALLAKGKAGHLELLRFLDELVANSKDLERFFQREQDAVRYVVPLVEFLVHRKGQVLGVIETVFETMAERPEAFADLGKDTLEIFTEGAAFILPGAVDEAQLAKFRGYANAILATPEGSLPEPVERQRRRIQQALMLWAPRLNAQDALAQLRSGTLRGGEAVQVLRGLPPEQVEGLDVVAILTPVVAELDYRTLRALRDVPLQPRDVDALDRVVLDTVAAGKAADWGVVQYLQATKRHAWPQPQVFLEEGFRRGGKALETCAQALRRVGGTVPTEYFQWVLETYDLSEGTRKLLEPRAIRKN